jgi:hypothetical protein
MLAKLLNPNETRIALKYLIAIHTKDLNEVIIGFVFVHHGTILLADLS